MSFGFYAQQGKKAKLFVGKGVHFVITKETQVITTGDVELKSSIKGQGNFKMSGKQNSKLDAHGNTIENLVVAKEGDAQVSIESELHIGHSLEVASGVLALKDANIILDKDAKVHKSASGKILFLGKGRIIHAIQQAIVFLIPDFQMHQAALPVKLTLVEPVSNELDLFVVIQNIKNTNSKPLTPPG